MVILKQALVGIFIKKELSIFKELSRILLNLSAKEMLIAITNGDIIEVKS